MEQRWKCRNQRVWPAYMAVRVLFPFWILKWFSLEQVELLSSPMVPQKCLLFIQGESGLIAFPCPCPRRTSSSPSSSRKSSRVLDAMRNVLHTERPEIRRTRKTINTFIARIFTLQAKQLKARPLPPSVAWLLPVWRLRISQMSLCTVRFNSSIFITDEMKRLQAQLLVVFGESVKVLR